MKYKLQRDYTKLGEYLAKGRESKNITQKTVSEVLNYSSAQFVSNFERGISAPPIKKLKVLMKMYGLDKKKVFSLYTGPLLKKTKEELGL